MREGVANLEEAALGVAPPYLHVEGVCYDILYLHGVPCEGYGVFVFVPFTLLGRGVRGGRSSNRGDIGELSRRRLLARV